MKYVADTNTLLAVALDEPEKEWLVDVTDGCELAAPAILPYEIGNALSALLKRKVIVSDQIIRIWDVIVNIPVELVEIDIRASVLLAAKFDVYAYDAYFLQCAVETRCPLMTLDEGMKRAARKMNIKLVEQR